MFGVVTFIRFAKGRPILQTNFRVGGAFFGCFSLAGVLVRPHLAQSLKFLHLSTTALYLSVVVVVVVGFGADLWNASRLSALVEKGQLLDSWWLGKP